MWHQRYLIFLIVVFFTLFATLIQGGELLLTGFSIDAIHSLFITEHILDGGMLHQDLHTPLGVLSFAPFVFLMNLGFGAGPAMGYGQALVALLLLPAIYWVGISRFRYALAAVYGALSLLMVLALLHGGVKPGVDISMHYNRWCWAMVWLLIAMILLPRQSDSRRAETYDGLVIGIIGAVIVFTKMTYALLGPVVLIALLMGKEWRVLGIAAGAFLVTSLAVIIPMGGFGYLAAYVADLTDLTGSDLRSYPGSSFPYLVFGPPFLLITVAAFYAIFRLRADGFDRQGLLLLLMLPVLYYITYQNWNNYAYWVVIIALVLWELAAARGAEMRPFGLRVTGVLLGVSIVPILIAMVTSSLLHIAVTNDDFEPIAERHPTLKLIASRFDRIEQRVALDGDRLPLEGDTVTFAGREWKACAITKGETQSAVKMVEDLAGLDALKGQPVILADTVQLLHMIGDFTWSPGMSPWYYGNPEHLDGAAYVVIPTCAAFQLAKQEVLKHLDAAARSPELQFETPHLAVYKLN